MPKRATTRLEQHTEVRAALAEADAGDFAPPRAVDAVAQKWGITARKKANRKCESGKVRNLFDELAEGIRALADDRKGRRPLRRRTVRRPR